MSISKVLLMQGNAFNIPLSDKSVQVVITSPPYFSLRDYGTQNQIGLEQLHDCLGWAIGETCEYCYVCNLRKWAREVWRVLRNDGVFWLNLGDSYNGSGGAGGDYNPGGLKEGQPRYKGRNISVLKPKDLIGIPFRAALALQADGWTLRSVPPWIKTNGMPENTPDRPTSTNEYWFLFSKQQKYYTDVYAIKKPLAQSSQVRLSQDIPNQKGSNRAHGGAKTNGPIKAAGNVDGRNYRTSDMFYDSLDDAIANIEIYLNYLKHTRARGGLLLSPDNEPLALLFNSRPYSGAHFATFNPSMIEPLMKFSTSERGCCPKCRTPWQRVIKREGYGNAKGQNFHGDTMSSSRRYKNLGGGSVLQEVVSIGWHPGCTCYGKPEIIDGECGKCEGTGRELQYASEKRRKEDAEKTGRTDGKTQGPSAQKNYKIETGEICPICNGTGVGKVEKWPDDIDEWPTEPCIVLDPFVGSGTTAMVAQKLGHIGIGLDLNMDYLNLAKDRTGITMLEGGSPKPKGKQEDITALPFIMAMQKK